MRHAEWRSILSAHYSYKRSQAKASERESKLGATEEASQGPSRHGPGMRLRDAPDQFRVELAPSACGAAAPELGGGAEPRAYSLADGLGLGEGLLSCARPARIRRSPHRAARPLG